jgi:predicted secreted hydrolase
VAAAQILTCAPAITVDARQFTQALPGFKFRFPGDHASHDDYRTEWWYFTGHLQAGNTQNYGYELTFFRLGMDQDENSKSPWNLRNIYLAHFAITDEQGHKFFYAEKMNRSGLNFAGASQDHPHVFNETWSMDQVWQDFVIKAKSADYAIDLTLKPSKPPVIHGENGVSPKANCKGCASHYYSMTRLGTTGRLTIENQVKQVSGLTWMDHEFGSNQLTEKQTGWDWYSLQLDNGYDVMLYVIRTAEGTIDPNSSGTVISPDGTASHLSKDAFKIESKSTWTSTKTNGRYPIEWHLSIPSAKAELDLTPVLKDQELVTKGSTGVSYWEGDSSVQGSWNNKPVRGKSYVEMTGYAEKFNTRI